MKLRTRLTLIYLLIVAFLLNFLGALFTNLAEKHFANSSSEMLFSQASGIASLLAEDTILDNRSLQHIVVNLGKNIKARVTILSLDGRVLADSNTNPETVQNQRNTPEVQEALKNGRGMSSSDTAQQTGMYYVTLRLEPKSNIEGIIRVGRAADEIDSELTTIFRIGVLSTAAAALLGILIGYFLVRSIVKPVGSMTAMAEQMATGDLSLRSDIVRNDEIGALANSLNTMADQLDARLKSLTASERRRQLLIDHMSDGIMMLSSNGSILIANAAIQSLLGSKAEKLIGRSLLEVMPAEELEKAIACACQKDDASECSITLGNRGQQIIMVKVLPIRDEENTLLVMMRDITKEQALDSMRKDFIANFSHELKTPITGLKLLAEALSDSLRDDRAEALYFADVIKDETGRLASFVEKMMGLARLDSNLTHYLIEKVSVEDVIAEVLQICEPLAREKDLELDVSLPGNAPLVDGDRSQIRMIVQNLIDNAIKYTKKGTVKISVSPSTDGNSVEFVVADSGVGISEEDLPHIFERFFRADKARNRATGGHGLGLSIVSKIVNMHGGTIDVSSQQGKGTTFKVLLPIEDKDSILYSTVSSSTI